MIASAIFAPACAPPEVCQSEDQTIAARRSVSGPAEWIRGRACADQRHRAVPLPDVAYGRGMHNHAIGMQADLRQLPHWHM